MDKEQIIVDGVDVSECIYLYSRWPNSLPREACGLFHSDNPYDNDNRCLCKYNPDCSFKQLARKTQECEELKDRIKKLRKNLALEIELTARYRKALEEIEEYIKEEEWSLLEYVIRDISNIIDKAKGEGNG